MLRIHLSMIAQTIKEAEPTHPMSDRCSPSYYDAIGINHGREFIASNIARRVQDENVDFDALEFFALCGLEGLTL